MSTATATATANTTAIAFLIAAEADHIQDVIFRASHLREVVGGSQLIADFCERVVPEIVANDAELHDTVELIVHDGGTFRASCADEQTARKFLRRLADEYYRATGASMTVAPEPVAFEAANFAQQHARICDSLRRAKASRGFPHSLSDLPYVAICASCGFGRAASFRSLDEFEFEQRSADGQAANSTEEANYLCHECAKKAKFRFRQQRSFLQRFQESVQQASGQQAVCVRTPEDLAKLDSRRYVAYLKADGNAMGS